jgi:hypothetical protein
MPPGKETFIIPNNACYWAEVARELTSTAALFVTSISPVLDMLGWRSSHTGPQPGHCIFWGKNFFLASFSPKKFVGET